jgi:hypothetical protein
VAPLLVEVIYSSQRGWCLFVAVASGQEMLAVTVAEEMLLRRRVLNETGSLAAEFGVASQMQLTRRTH